MLVRLSNGKVALAAFTGYMCADWNRGQQVWADRTAIGPWEQWDLISNGGNSISLCSNTGQYFTALDVDSHQLYSRANQNGPWERFAAEWQEMVRLRYVRFSGTNMLASHHNGLRCDICFR